MTKAPIKLSDTGRAMLTLAATREDRLVRPPQLPMAAARQVVRSLLNHGLVEEVPASSNDPVYVWRQTEDGSALVLRAAPVGLAAVGAPVDPPAADTLDAHGSTEPDQLPGASPTAEASPDASTAPVRVNDRQTLREAALAVLSAWDDAIDGCPALPTAMDQLRSRLMASARLPRQSGGTRASRARSSSRTSSRTSATSATTPTDARGRHR